MRLDGIGGVYDCYFSGEKCDFGYETSTAGRYTEAEMKAPGFVSGPGLSECFRYFQGGYPRLFWE